MDWRRLSLAANLLALAGCSFLSETKETAPPLPSQNTPPALPGKPSLPPPPYFPPPPAKPFLKPEANPDELVGLSEEAVVMLLGLAAETGSEGTARILTYRGKACSIDVILFPNVKTGERRVLSYQIVEDPAQPLLAQHCYDDLRSAR